MEIQIEEIKKFYFDGTKHSLYQNIPTFIQKSINYNVTIDETWRGDTARYSNLLENLNFKNIKSIGDIGANTGFFSLSLAEKYPEISVQAYEGNQNHCNLIDKLKTAFNLKNIVVSNKYVDLEGLNSINVHDCILNYNVLHHAGVDFDKEQVTLNTFSDYAQKYLAQLSQKSKYMIFQMGFNWGGDKTKPIVSYENEVQKIIFMSKIFRKSNWSIDQIFLVNNLSELKYFQIDTELTGKLNLQTSDILSALKEYLSKHDFSHLSEFYRRPIFYLKSNHFKNDLHWSI